MKRILLVFAVVLLFTANAYATPILWSGNGNYYEFVIPTSTNDWFSAKASASSSTYLGFSGHLVTISSQEENDFIYSLVTGSHTGFTGAWLGGKAPEGWLVGPENGQAFSYTNWGGAEPNNNGYAYMNIGDGTVYINGGLWADDSYTQGIPDVFDPVIGYFVEYEATPVPEPASMLLLGSGLIGLAGLRKKLKKS